jgi:hypothetical protein
MQYGKTDCMRGDCCFDGIDYNFGKPYRDTLDVEKLTTFYDKSLEELYDYFAPLKKALEGSKAVAYINGAKIGETDLSGNGITANSKAQIILIMYGNNGQTFESPFTPG